MSDRSFVERLADNAQIKADKAKAQMNHAKDKASCESIAKNYASAEYWRGVAEDHSRWVSYWLGHVNAYKGIAAGLELREIVEEETDAEPTCP